MHPTAAYTALGRVSSRSKFPDDARGRLQGCRRTSALRSNRCRRAGRPRPIASPAGRRRSRRATRTIARSRLAIGFPCGRTARMLKCYRTHARWHYSTTVLCGVRMRAGNGLHSLTEGSRLHQKAALAVKHLRAAPAKVVCKRGRGPAALGSLRQLLRPTVITIVILRNTCRRTRSWRS